MEDSLGVTLQLELQLTSGIGAQASAELISDVRESVVLFAIEKGLTNALQKATGISDLQIDRVHAIENNVIVLHPSVDTNSQYSRLTALARSGQLQRIVEHVIVQEALIPENCSVNIKVMSEKGIAPLDSRYGVVSGEQKVWSPITTPSSYDAAKAASMVEVTLHVFSTAYGIDILSKNESVDKTQMKRSNTMENIFSATVRVPAKSTLTYRYRFLHYRDYLYFDGVTVSPEYTEETFMRTVSIPSRPLVIRDCGGIPANSPWPTKGIVTHSCHIIQAASVDNLYEITEQIVKLISHKGISDISDSKKEEIAKGIAETLFRSSVDLYKKCEHYLAFLTLLSSFGCFNIRSILFRKECQNILESCTAMSQDFCEKSRMNIAPIMKRICQAVYEDKACVFMLMKHAYPFLTEQDCNKLIRYPKQNPFKIYVKGTMMPQNISEIISLVCDRTVAAETLIDDGRDLLRSIVRALPLSMLDTCTQTPIRKLDQLELRKSSIIVKKVRETICDAIIERCHEEIIQAKNFYHLHQIIMIDACPFRDHLLEIILDRCKELCLESEKSDAVIPNTECKHMEIICVEGFKANEKMQWDFLREIAKSKEDFSGLVLSLLCNDVFTSRPYDCRDTAMKLMKKHAKKAKKRGDIESVYFYLKKALMIPSVKQSQQCPEDLKDIAFQCMKSMDIREVIEEATHGEWAESEMFSLFIQHVRLILQSPDERGRFVYGKRLLTSLYDGKPAVIETREKAGLVVLLMDLVSPIDKDAPMNETLTKLMENAKFWRSILTASGSSKGIIACESETYQKVFNSLKLLPTILKDYKFGESLMSNLRKWLSDDTCMAVLCLYESKDVLQHLIEVGYKKLMDTDSKMLLFTAELRQITQKLPCYLEDVVLNDLEFVIQHCSNQIKSLRSDKWKVSEFLELPILNLITDTQPYFKAVKILQKSEVFWRVNKETLIACKTNLGRTASTDPDTNEIEEIYDRSSEHRGDDIRLNFDSPLEGCIEQVRLFFVCLGKDCLHNYMEIWKPFLNRIDITVGEVREMFDGTNIDDEIQVMEGYTKKNLLPICADDLKTFCNHRKYKDRVSAMIKALETFGIDNRQDTKLNKALNVYQTLESENIGEKILWDLSKDLLEVYSVASVIDNEMFSILKILGSSSTLINFLKTVVDEDLTNLTDAVEEYTETLSHAQESTVSSLIEVKRFVYPLLKIPVEGPVEDFFAKLIEQHKSSGVTFVDRKLEDCNANVHSLKELYESKAANRAHQTMTIVQSILSAGSFVFSLKKEECNIEVKVIMDLRLQSGDMVIDKSKTLYERTSLQGVRQREQRYREAELSDLRSRSHLIINTSLSGNNDRCSEETSLMENKKEQLTEFIAEIDKAFNIAKVCTELHSQGHYRYTQFEEDVDRRMLDDKLGELQEDLKLWEDLLGDIRERYYFMNFVQPDHIPVLHKYLSTRGKEGRSDVQSILQYIKPNAVLQAEAVDDIVDDPRSVLECIAAMLTNAVVTGSEYTPAFSFPLEKYEADTITVQAGQLFIAKLYDRSARRGIQTMLSIYHANGKSLPAANQVILCTPETEWNELRLLLQRCRRAKEYETGQQRLFCIVNADELPTDVQTNLSKEIHSMDDETDYRLAVVFRGDDNQAFLHYFPNHVYFIEPLTDMETERCIKHLCENVMVVTSVSPGLGKTEFIRNAVFTTKHAAFLTQRPKLVTLHISGVMQKENLIQQLKALKIRKETILHIDVGMIDKPEELDLFLFQLIVLKYVSHGRMSIYLQTSTVYIEIANTVNNTLIDKLQIISFFKRKELTWNDYRDFRVSVEPASPVQVVCRYLQCLQNNTIDIVELSFCGTGAKILQVSDCRGLLKQYFSLDGDISFTLVNIFISVLAKQLQRFTVSNFFKIKFIKDFPAARSSMVKAMIEISRDFACRSVTNYRKVQAYSQEQIAAARIDSDHKPENEMKTLTDGMIRWEDSKHIVTVFHQDNHTISILYKQMENEAPHISCIRELIKHHTRKEEESLEKKSQEELKDMLLRIVSRTGEEPLAFASRMKSYVLTPDNFLKFALISLRIQAQIPVILMGETGCGKTSVVRNLAVLCGVELEEFCIHAGITEKKILSTVWKCNDKAKENFNKEIWLFLDEINTNVHIGLFAELMSHHRCQGKLLAPNLVFIAACNPYRYRDKHHVLSEGLKDNHTMTSDELSNLVYRVYPLPESLVDFVWDFGTLSEKDESEYIKRMLQSCMDIFRSTKLVTIFTNLVITSQKFVRDNEKTEYSVSLRDVDRCKHLAIWFLQYYLKKKENLQYFEEDHVLTAMLLSLSICYYIRFRLRDTRKRYLKHVSCTLTQHSKNYSDIYIRQNILTEEKDILDRMILPPGTAKNASLQENVFVMLVCILNKLPLFVVGKPGCSKSLALQLMRNNMRGLDSKDDFFKKLPHLYCVSYQGSEQSTSEGIEKVFVKALNYQNVNTKYEQEQGSIDEKIRALLVLDEVGLAEKSHANPLKVLHSLLESSGGVCCKVAFIGISNWALDAAKMNRAIHLSRPEMDLEELFETGRSIHESIDSTSLKDNPKNLELLAEGYNEYVQAQKMRHFHGLRDYYSLIKYVSTFTEFTMTKTKKQDIIQTGILRNFSGMRKEYSHAKDVFQRHLQLGSFNDREITELIRQNIKDQGSRHLLLVSNGDSIVGTVEKLLDDIDREYTTMIGSNFPLDRSEEYGYRILSNIILCMEQGQVLILKNLEGIHGSLYDMLNQSYTIVGHKKHCRIALGPHSNPMCYVHDSFKCVVIVEEDRLPLADPPFLNRFEKQIFSFVDKLSAMQRTIIECLKKDIKSMCILVDDHEQDFDPQKLSPVLDSDKLSSILASLVLCIVHKQRFEQRDLGCEDLRKMALEAIIPMFHPEAVLRLPFSEFWKNNENIGEHLQSIYFGMQFHNGLQTFLEKSTYTSHGMNSVQESLYSKMFLIFTHSNPLVHINDCFGQEDFVDITLGTISSEKEFHDRMKEFWIHSHSPLLIIRASATDDIANILLTKVIVETWRRKNLNISNCKTKHVAFIIHLDRNQRTSLGSKIDFSSEWEMVTMDTLKEPIQTLPEMIGKKVSEVLHDRRNHLGKVVKDSLHWAFHRIHYLDGSHTDRIEKVVQTISKEQEIKDAFVAIILKYIDNKEEQTDESKHREMQWIVDIAKNQEAVSSSHTLTYAVENFLLEQIKQTLAMLIYRLEDKDALNSLTDSTSTERMERWLKLLNKQNFMNLSNIMKPKGPGCYDIGRSGRNFRIPFAKVFIDRLNTLRESIVGSGRSEVEDSSDHEEDFRQEIIKVRKQIRELNEMQYDGIKSDYLHDYYTYTFLSTFQTSANRMHDLIWIMSQFGDWRGSLMEGTLTELVARLHYGYLKYSSKILAVFGLLEIAPVLGIDYSQNYISSEMDNGENTSSDISVSHLVKTLCTAAVPSSKFGTLEKDSDLTSWQQKANRILCLSQHIDEDLEEIDILKFFIELVDILRPERLSKCLFNLFTLAEHLIADGNQIDDLIVYQSLMALLQRLHQTSEGSEQHISPNLLNQAMAMYMNRCISTNRCGRERICDLLTHLQTPHVIFDTPLTNFGSTLTFYVTEENQDGFFEKLLQTESEADVTKLLDDCSTFLKELNKSLLDQQIGPSLKLLLLDILEMHVFEYINYEDIYDIATGDHSLLKMAGNAYKLASDQKTSLSQITGLSFLKVFLKEVAECMEKPSQCALNYADNRILFDRINTLLCYEEAVTVGERYWANYFLKCLMGSQGPCSLRSCCSHFEEIAICKSFHQEAIKLENSYELEGRTMFSESVYKDISISVAQYDKQKLQDILGSENPESISCVLEYLKSRLFLKRHHDSDLPVSIKENFTRLSNLAETTCYDDLDWKLIGLFSLSKDPENKLLKRMSLVEMPLHLVICSSNAVCAIFQYGLKTGFWFDCLKNPKNVKQAFHPSYSSFDYDVKYMNETLDFQRIAKLRDESVNCDEDKALSVVLMDDFTYCKSGRFSPIGFHFFQLLAKSCLLFSKAMRFINDSDIRDILEFPEEIDVDDYLQNKLEHHWNNLCLLINIGSGEMTLFVKTVVAEIGIDLFKNIPMYGLTTERLDWEANITSQLHNIIERRETLVCQHATDCNELFEVDENCYWYQLTRRVEDKTSSRFQDIFTKISSPSIENMFGELCLSTTSHPFLKLVIEHYDELKLPQYIPSLIKWHSFMASTCSYHLNKVDCGSNMTTLRNRLSDENLKKTFLEKFDDFLKTWDALKLHCDTIASPVVPEIKPLGMDSKISDCLLLGSDSLIYQVIESFAMIQNNFLDSVLKLSMESECLPVSFYRNGDGSVSLPVTSLMDTTSNNVLNLIEEEIDSNTSTDMLSELMNMFSECCTCSGRRSRIVYNFTKIEFEMAQGMLLGKTFISLKTRVPRMQFMDDTFQNTMSLIADVKESVPQKPLPKEIIKKLKIGTRTLPLKDLLTMSGSVLAHLSHTGGNPDTSLAKYLQTWKGVLLQNLEKEQIPSSEEQLCLKHAVAFYRLMEELVGEMELKHLPSSFRIKLPKSAETLIDKTRDIELMECLASAVKVFIYRNLTTDRELIQKEEDLIAYLQDSSFWPEECVDDKGYFILFQDGKPQLSELIDPFLKVHHIGSFAIKLLGVIEKRPHRTAVPSRALQADQVPVQRDNRPVRKPKKRKF